MQQATASEASSHVEKEERQEPQEHHLDEDLSQWSPDQAVIRILKASNAYEMFGLHPRKLTDHTCIRVRYRRLSLLTHPDKNRNQEAPAAFRKVRDAHQVLTDDGEQRKLLEKIEAAAAAEAKKYQVFNADWLIPVPSEEHQMQAVAQAAREALDKTESDKMRQRNCLEELLAQHGPGAWKRRPRGVDMSEPWGAEVVPPAKRKVGGAAAPVTVQPPQQAAASEQADPAMLFAFMGSSGLERNGWQRLESRRNPGVFYFLHTASGKSVADATTTPKPASAAAKHTGWERRESRSRPGAFYFVNTRTGETRVDPPSDFVGGK